MYLAGKPHTKDNRLGSIQATTRVECSWFGCSDYHRSTDGAVFPDGLVKMARSDNGGTPKAGYYGDFTLTNN